MALKWLDVFSYMKLGIFWFAFFTDTSVNNIKHLLGGGNSNIFYFHPENWGRFPPNLTCAFFSDGLVIQPPTSYV